MPLLSTTAASSSLLSSFFESCCFSRRRFLPRFDLSKRADDDKTLNSSSMMPVYRRMLRRTIGILNNSGVVAFAHINHRTRRHTKVIGRTSEGN